MTTGPTRKIEMTKILIEIDTDTQRVVPIEPTRAMCAAALAFDDNKPLNDWGKIVSITYEETYSAMISAALLPEQVESEPVIIEEPNYHFEGMGCGLEDRNITDRYEAMEYGWDCAISRMFERIPDGPLYTTPQPDRTAELEAALKVARDGIDKFLVANDPTEFGCACDLSVGYLCGPCHADMQQQPLKIALAKINEVLHD